MMSAARHFAVIQIVCDLHPGLLASATSCASRRAVPSGKPSFRKAPHKAGSRRDSRVLPTIQDCWYQAGANAAPPSKLFARCFQLVSPAQIQDRLQAASSSDIRLNRAADQIGCALCGFAWEKHAPL